jgi:hypothetical protein
LAKVFDFQNGKSQDFQDGCLDATNGENKKKLWAYYPKVSSHQVSLK